MFLPLIKDVYIFIPREFYIVTISSVHMFRRIHMLSFNIHLCVSSVCTHIYICLLYTSPLFITTKPYYLRFGPKMKVWWNYTYLNVSKEPTKEWGILISTIIYLIFFQYETHKFTIRMPLIVCLIWVYKKNRKI